MKNLKMCVFLIGCGMLAATIILCVADYNDWLEENEVVAYNPGTVEIAAPFIYDVDDIGEKQTVFACRITTFAWGEQDAIWVFQKDGTCRKKDLVEEAEALGKMNQKRYEPEKLSEEALLARMDEYMQDETIPETDEKLLLDKKIICRCINITNISLEKEEESVMDAGGVTIYVVTGTGENRRLEEVYLGGAETYTCGDEEIEQVCKQITKVIGS